MTDIVVLNKKFEKAAPLKTDVDLSADKINVPVVHQVVKATLAGRRQGTAATKNKALVSGGGKKPFKQKGTGNARQGSKRSPLMPGGGTTFGPQPRSYEQKVNKKVMELAIHSIIADKFQAGKLTVVDSVESTGKTKDMFKTLSERNLLPALVVTNEMNDKVSLATRNIARAKYAPVSGFSVYEAVKFENLVIEKAALEKLLSRLV
ncbi:MAG: 50S ribosomal protein L4 [Proteobacteria bacterium]|jgi:large subunit ribosomal protein L4|nr:50S ribosomal protein L4 [Pseudomonadota bacterium]